MNGLLVLAPLRSRSQSGTLFLLPLLGLLLGLDPPELFLQNGFFLTVARTIRASRLVLFFLLDLLVGLSGLPSVVCQVVVIFLESHVTGIRKGQIRNGSPSNLQLFVFSLVRSLGLLL